MYKHTKIQHVSKDIVYEGLKYGKIVDQGEGYNKVFTESIADREA